MDGAKFKLKTAWTTNGTDDFGFSVLPVGAQFFKDSIIYNNCYGGCHTPYYVVPGVTAKFFAGMGMSVSFNIRPLYVSLSYGSLYEQLSYDYITFTDTSWVKEMHSTRKTNAGSIRCIQDWLCPSSEVKRVRTYSSEAVHKKGLSRSSRQALFIPFFTSPGWRWFPKCYFQRISFCFWDCSLNCTSSAFAGCIVLGLFKKHRAFFSIDFNDFFTREI